MEKEDKSFICYFDNKTQEISKLLDISKLNYANIQSNFGKVMVLGTNEEGGYTLFSVSENGAKEILKFDWGTYDVTLMGYNYTLAISEIHTGKSYLINVDLRNDEITWIDETQFFKVEDGLYYGTKIKIGGGYGDKIYYIIGLDDKDNNSSEFALVEYSISKQKKLAKYPIKNGFKTIISLGNTFVISEYGENSWHLYKKGKYSEDKMGPLIYLKSFKELDEGDTTLSDYSVTDNYILMISTEGLIYKVNPKNQTYEVVDLKNKGKEYMANKYITIFEDGFVDVEISDNIYTVEFKTFEQLKKEYQNSKVY